MKDTSGDSRPDKKENERCKARTGWMVFSLLAAGILFLSACEKNTGLTERMIPGETESTYWWTPTPEQGITEVPEEYRIPGVTNGMAGETCDDIIEPPENLEGMEFFIPQGGTLEAGATELQYNPLSVVQSAVNAAGFGIVESKSSTGVKTGNMCISIVPEQLYNPNLPGGVEHLNQGKSEYGVSVYDETQIFMQVQLPKDTDEATYTCALGYARNNNTEYENGTLRQLLIETTADGSKVIASMQAGFSIAEDVAVLNGTIYVDGQIQGWDMVDGAKFPGTWSLEIPATPEECKNVIRSDTFVHTSDDIAALNQYIMDHRPAGEDFSEMKFNYMSSHFMPNGAWPFEFFDINPYPVDGRNEYNKLLSCSMYGDGMVYGMFLPVGNGENQTLIPVQVFWDSNLMEQIYSKAGIDNPYEQRIIDNNNNNKIQTSTWRLSGYFVKVEDQYTNSLSAIYGKYLDETYDYSNRLLDLMTNYGANPARDQETIELLQNIMLLGYVSPTQAY